MHRVPVTSEGFLCLWMRSSIGDVPAAIFFLQSEVVSALYKSQGMLFQRKWLKIVSEAISADDKSW